MILSVSLINREANYHRADILHDVFKSRAVTPAGQLGTAYFSQMQSNTHLQVIWQHLNLYFWFLSVLTWHRYNIAICTKVTQLVCAFTIQKQTLWICFSYHLAQALVQYLSNKLLHLFVCNYINIRPAHDLWAWQPSLLHPLLSWKNYFALIAGKSLFTLWCCCSNTSEVLGTISINWMGEANTFWIIRSYCPGATCTLRVIGYGWQTS